MRTVREKPTLKDRLRQWARAIKRDVHALWLAARDSRTPLVAKLLALVTAAYALSPIDLIPDFIPVIGYLDDLVLVPLGIVLVVRLIPPELMQEYRAMAAMAAQRPVSRIAAGVFVTIWLVSAIGVTYLLVR
jgi:uncharacterized membrane protein YkvA (DUF1232 family)